MSRAPCKFQRGSGLSLKCSTNYHEYIAQIVQPAHVDLNKVKPESYRYEKQKLEEWSLREGPVPFSSKIVKANRQKE